MAVLTQENKFKETVQNKNEVVYNSTLWVMLVPCVYLTASSD